MAKSTSVVVGNKIRGEMLALTYWVSVEKVDSADKILVKDLYDGGQFFVQGKDLIDSTMSADAFTKTEKITKMEMAEKLISLYGKPFTVCFDTQKETNRVLRGKLLSSEPLLGRSYVEDLDIAIGEHRTRLVDHRTIHWLICGNTKFVVK